jgi:hypothetical protein
MAEPVVVTIPHKLTKEEAVRRLKKGFGDVRSTVREKFVVLTDDWAGDHLDFRASLLGQTTTGTVDVGEHSVHELEFLREQSAHRRLGFAPDQIKRWLKNAGVTVERQRDLAPAASVGSEKLTVSLWLGMKPALSREKKKRSSVEFAA